MATVYMSEAEVAHDLHAVLARVKQGIDVVISQENGPVAVLSANVAPSQVLRKGSGRPLDEILHDAGLRNVGATLDEEFGKDLEEIIASQQRPWNPRSWE